MAFAGFQNNCHLETVYTYITRSIYAISYQILIVKEKDIITKTLQSYPKSTDQQEANQQNVKSHL